jgi:hypothetical protein
MSQISKAIHLWENNGHAAVAILWRDKTVTVYDVDSSTECVWTDGICINLSGIRVSESALDIVDTFYKGLSTYSGINCRKASVGTNTRHDVETWIAQQTTSNCFTFASNMYDYLTWK